MRFLLRPLFLVCVAVVCVAGAALLSGCSTFTYDLSSVPFEVSARPAAVAAQPFHIEKKSILWAHGLFGETNPDVAALITELGEGCKGIAGFKVKVAGGFHDWLITHLTGTLVRMKTVTIEGELIR